MTMLGKYVDFVREVSKILEVDQSDGFAWDVLKKWPLGPIILGHLGASWGRLGGVLGALVDPKFDFCDTSHAKSTFF